MDTTDGVDRLKGFRCTLALSSFLRVWWWICLTKPAWEVRFRFTLRHTWPRPRINPYGLGESVCRITVRIAPNVGQRQLKSCGKTFLMNHLECGRWPRQQPRTPDGFTSYGVVTCTEPAGRFWTSKRFVCILRYMGWTARVWCRPWHWNQSASWREGDGDPAILRLPWMSKIWPKTSSSIMADQKTF